MVETLIDVFISHSNEEKTKAGELKEKLQNESMRVFLAHDDIDGGEEWMKSLYENIQYCDVFLVLLSKQYHQANYTDQETGVAYAMNKPMIPITIDGTDPYGFMAKYQATKATLPFSEEKIDEIRNLIFAHTKQGQEMINGLIHQLQEAYTFANANVVGNMLFSYTKFSKEQLNNIAKAVIENNQVRGAWTAFPLASDMLKQNMKKIAPSIQEELKRYL